MATTGQAAGVDVSLTVSPCDHVTCAFAPGALDKIDAWMGRAQHPNTLGHRTEST
jgi:hypothetical protein